MWEHCRGRATGQKGDTFSKIVQMYINKCKRFGTSVVIFDGYEASKKDATHNVRSGKMSQVVMIMAENCCPPEVYHQITVWKDRSDVNKDPLHVGDGSVE